MTKLILSLLTLCATLVVQIHCNELELQASLAQNLIAGSSEPRPSKSFIPEEFLKDALVAQLECGESRTLATGSDYLLQSANFPQSSPQDSNCAWSFTVPANQAVDLLFYSIDIPCSDSNTNSLNIRVNRRNQDICLICANNQRVQLKKRTSESKLRISYSGSVKFSLVVQPTGGSDDNSNAISEEASQVALPAQLQCPQAETNRRTKIVDGRPAERSEYPFQILLLAGGGLCGGTIISNRWILTAAHCTQGVSTSRISVYTGCHNFRAGDCDSARAVDRNTVHPNYQSRNIDNDVAILRLRSTMTFNSRRRRVTLARPNQYTRGGQHLMAVGWGRDNNGNTAGVLREGRVTAISDETCRRTWPWVDGSILCTLPRVNKGGSGSTCNGDSGGFLGQWFPGPTWRQVGVTSYGSPDCRARIPSGFAEVRAFYNWINNNCGQCLT